VITSLVWLGSFLALLLLFGSFGAMSVYELALVVLLSVIITAAVRRLRARAAS
jgi:hypothetical protein